MTPRNSRLPTGYRPIMLAAINAIEARQRRNDHIADIIAGLVVGLAIGLQLGMWIIWWLR